MAVVYRLVGYDRKTERQSVKFDIPPEHVAFAKKVARLDPSRDLIADHPLTDAQARDIAGAIGQGLDIARHEFFLEPYVAAPA